MIERGLAVIGRQTMESYGRMRETAQMGVAIASRLVPPRVDGPELLRNLYNVGVKSFIIIVITALFSGAIMVIQAGLYVNSYGAQGLLGWAASFATLREVSPLMTALMFNGRVGAKNTAELGTMQVTEQIDALRALAINPIDYLVMPRFLAMVVMMTALVVVGDVVAILGGVATSWALLGVEPWLFFASFLEYTQLEDVLLGVYKALAFGVAIALISCTHGVAVKGGAVGVGRAVNDSVVVSAIWIFILNYLVTWVIF